MTTNTGAARLSLAIKLSLSREPEERDYPTSAEQRAEDALAERIARGTVPEIFDESYVIGALALVVPLFPITRGDGPEINAKWESKNRGCVRYRGPRLSQSHQSLLLVLLKLLSKQVVLETVSIDIEPRKLLKEMHWSDSKARRASLREMLTDLQSARLRVWKWGQDEETEAARTCILSEFTPAKTGTWNIRINPSCVDLLFGPPTVLKLSVRNKLREGIATFIYGYVAANTGILRNGERVHYTFSMLHELSGSTAKDMSEFRDSVCSALDQLIELKVVDKYERTKLDVVVYKTVKRKYTKKS